MVFAQPGYCVTKATTVGASAGVPFHYRFIQPDAFSNRVAPGPPRQPFYSDDIGPVHLA